MTTPTVQAVAREMFGAGLTSRDHHARIKSIYKKATGSMPTKDEYSTIIETFKEMEEQMVPTPEVEPSEGEKAVAKAMGAPAKKPKKKARERKLPTNIPSPEEALDIARESGDAKWNKVVKVTAQGKTGNITRVLILCEDKGPNGEDLFRDIAVQDLHQVRFSVEGAKREQRRKRQQARTQKARERRDLANKLSDRV